MHILKKFGVMSLLVVTVLSFAGCDWFDKDESDPGARETIQEALKNMYDVDTYKYNISLKGDIESEDGPSDFVLTLYGEEDYSDLTAPKFNLKMSAEGNMEGVSGKLGDLEMRFDGANVYLRLSDLNDFGGALPIEVVSQFVDKWWSIPLPPESLEGSFLFSNKKDVSAMTAEEKQLKETFENASLLTNIKNKGLMNDQVYFEALLDKDGFKDYVKDLSKASTGSMSAEEEKAFDEFLEALDVDVEVWISEEDNLIHRFVANIGLDDDEMKFSIVADVDIVAFNEAVEVEIPAESEEFDPLMLLGLAGGLQQ